MKLTLLTIFLCAVHLCLAQSHAEVVAKINSIEEARNFASKHRDVNVTIVDAENDVFLFDKIDTSDMHSYVGKVETMYRRSTKFLKDTVVHISKVQFVRFNSDLISIEQAELQAEEIIKDHKSGMSYLNIRKKYQSSQVLFSGGPKLDADLKGEFDSDFQSRPLNEMFLANSSNNPDYPTIALVRVKSHSVPAFIAISYNEMGGRYSGHFIND
ncbi:MAG: hypothetical protein MK105_12105 [Crocinitomicaceae bacterium]|nr:hypothetical protein [Crocinitomicaceae bacterium]